MNDFQPIKESILPKIHFLNCLRIEKKRADRSRVPLSIALFSIQEEKINGREKIQAFLRSLQKNSRESDVKGWMDHHVIGLILPETSEKGVQCFIEKILNGHKDIIHSVRTGTYPDDLFNHLLAENQGQSGLFPIDLDDSLQPKKLQAALKRGMDIAGAILGLLLSSPLMLLTAITIKINSEGPVIFRQLRIGRKGTRFSFYKFRSMYCNVDDHVHREYVSNLIQGNLDKINQGEEGRPLYKMKSDSRVTWVGQMIRKTSIDELPQFFNVLKGEMSLVGPRPPILYEVEKYEPWHIRRILEVKPGITGLWQVGGRSSVSFDEMVRLDLKYAQGWSLWVDLKILLKTVKAVICSKGAL